MSLITYVPLNPKPLNPILIMKGPYRPLERNPKPQHLAQASVSVALGACISGARSVRLCVCVCVKTYIYIYVPMYVYIYLFVRCACYVHTRACVSLSVFLCWLCVYPLFCMVCVCVCIFPNLFCENSSAMPTRRQPSSEAHLHRRSETTYEHRLFWC